MGSKFNSFLRKRCFFFSFVPVRDIAKTFTSLDLSFNGVILYSKKLYAFDLVYVKSNSITC